MASLSSGRPPAGVYLWLRGSRQAAAAASAIGAGVGKSGSPAPKPITSSPAACRALALASMARVADSDTLDMRCEMRAIACNSFTVTNPPQIEIPADLLPRDGRFGSGPSKVRREQIDAIRQV